MALYNFAILFILSLIFVAALPGFLNPTKGSNLHDEIQYYSIPYGVIGFASHLLTYRTFLCLCEGVRPLWPSKPITHAVWDCILAALVLVFTIALAIFTLIRRRNRWQFMLIAIWKICLSSTLSFAIITISILLRERVDTWSGRSFTPEPGYAKKSGGWLILYGIGLIIGMVGVVSLAKEEWNLREVRLITYSFGGLAGGLTLIAAIASSIGICVSGLNDGLVIMDPLGVCFGAFGFLAVLHSDWLLGAIVGDLGGVLSSDNAVLYWIYFAAKRLPLASA